MFSYQVGGYRNFIYVYSPPIVQILINFIICIYYLYIYVQIGNKISIYLSIFCIKKINHLLFFINTWCYHIYNIPIGFSDLENVGVDTKFVFLG